MGHSAQGKTLPKVLVNLAEGGFAAYVAASRPRMRMGLCLMQEVKIQDLNKLISTDLLAEVHGFDAIEHNTLVQHGFCSGQLVPVPDSEAEKSQLCNLL